METKLYKKLLKKYIQTLTPILTSAKRRKQDGFVSIILDNVNKLKALMQQDEIQYFEVRDVQSEAGAIVHMARIEKETKAKDEKKPYKTWISAQKLSKPLKKAKTKPSKKISKKTKKASKRKFRGWCGII